MDLITSPINNISNENENLIIQSEPDGQQNANIDQYYSKKKDKLSDINNRFAINCNYCCFAVISISSIILLGTIIPTILLPKLELYERIIIILVGSILEIIILIFSGYKIVLLKDESNKKIVIKVINFLCYAKKIINLDLENTHFYIKERLTPSDEGDNASYALIIINDFKNLVDIDLDESNIKQKPAKYLYCFDNISLGKYSRLRLIDYLNDFVGSPRDYKNPLFFNINEYLKKNK